MYTSLASRLCCKSSRVSLNSTCICLHVTKSTYMWHDSFTCDTTKHHVHHSTLPLHTTLLILMGHDSVTSDMALGNRVYGVALVSRIEKIIGLFCKNPYKREDILQKRPIILSILLTIATPYLLIPPVHVTWLVYAWHDAWLIRL